jgi:hypothetical protein
LVRLLPLVDCSLLIPITCRKALMVGNQPENNR